jgi:hypothetical protein
MTAATQSEKALPMKRAIMIGALTAALCGCSTTSKDLNGLSLGMSREQVVARLGQPDSTAAHGDRLLLTFWLKRAKVGGTGEYFVELVNGEVTAFGNKDDFKNMSDLDKQDATK